MSDNCQHCSSCLQIGSRYKCMHMVTGIQIWAMQINFLLLYIIF